MAYLSDDEASQAVQDSVQSLPKFNGAIEPWQVQRLTER